MPSTTKSPSLSAQLLSARLEALRLERLKRERARRNAAGSLYDFTRAAWPIVEKGRAMQDNWHIALICDALEAVTRREIKRLVINIPFRCMKSTLVSVMWPVWTWLHQPSHQWLTGSHKIALATRDALKSRRLIQSAWFQRHFGHEFALTGDQNQKTRYENDRAGFRLVFGMDAGITGEGADTIVIDDPHDRKQAQSDVQRQSTLETFDESIISRLNDPASGAIVIIMQRLHELDLAGHVLKSGDNWDWLCLPMEYDPDHPGCSPDDPRKEPGELLWPARFPAATVATLKRSLGVTGAANQLQQRGSQKGGGVVKTHLLRFYEDRPTNFDRTCFAWDMTFKKTTDGSFVVGQVWGRRGPDFFLLDEVRDRMGFTDALSAVLNLKARWPAVRAVLVEDKANGPAIMDVLRRKVPGVIAVDTGSDSKQARGESVVPLIEAGNVHVPSPRTSPWIHEWLAEVQHFPQEPNDRWDAATHALTWLGGGEASLFDLLPQAMANVRNWKR